MEINAINQLRRTAARTPEKKTGTPTAETSSTPAKSDSVSVVERAVKQLKEQNQRLEALLQQDRQEPKQPAIWDIVDSVTGEDGGEADALGEQLKTVERCQKIASRIMRGDKVPPEDERYLMEHDPEGYKLALAMRRHKKDPKEWESVLEEEEKTSESSGETSEVSSCEGAGEASGTGGDSGGGDAPSGDE